MLLAPLPPQGGFSVTSEELAALELLKSTGLPILEAAQVACVAMRAADGSMDKALRTIQLGADELKKREHTVSLSVAAWASVEARKDLRPTTRRDLRHWVPDVCRIPPNTLRGKYTQP